MWLNWQCRQTYTVTLRPPLTPTRYVHNIHSYHPKTVLQKNEQVPSPPELDPSN